MTDKRHHDAAAIQSMTGYALCSGEVEPALSVELRGVNSRFLDLAFRLPDELRALEPALRDLLRGGIARGKVECRVSLRSAMVTRAANPDPEALQAIAGWLAHLKQAIPALAPPSASDLLRLPELFAESVDEAVLHARALALAGEALGQFTASRHREGVRLAAVIEQRLADIDAIADALRSRVPELLAAFEARLAARITAAIEAVPGSADLPAAERVARVSQEVAVFGLRADVAEELDRLVAHVAECRLLLAGNGPVGKRLDFLTQELNREANTLGAKASALDLSRAAIDLKVLIEQIREQVQNLE